MNSKCPLCWCDAAHVVGHLMEAHKRTVHEAMDLVNAQYVKGMPEPSPEWTQKAIENLERIGRMRR